MEIYRLTEPKHQGMSHLGNKFFNQTLREIRGGRCRYIDQNARCEVDPFGRCALSRGCSRLDENISFSPRGWILSTECPCVRGIYERERERGGGKRERGSSPSVKSFVQDESARNARKLNSWRKYRRDEPTNNPSRVSPHTPRHPRALARIHPGLCLIY